MDLPPNNSEDRPRRRMWHGRLVRLGRSGQSSANGPSHVFPKPIHEKPLTVNPQLSSPFYNGRIPAEIRDQIFLYALSEYTKDDPGSQYSVSTNYTRPGYTGMRKVCIALLLTCRKVYLETYFLPPKMKEHVFWHGRSPRSESFLRSIFT